MKEDFLHFVWKNKKFKLNKLRSTNGETIEILSFGHWNHDAGPDFLEAEIKIDSQIWVGHVEIHVHASEWLQHKHQLDKKYNQTILHVVYEEDKKIYNNGDLLPCLILKNRILPHTLKHYTNLKSAPTFIPCENLIHRVKSEDKSIWIENLALERLKMKSNKHLEMLEWVKGDWESLFFRQTAYYLGASKNKDQMLQMANHIPIHLVRKHCDKSRILEALFFGQAGLLARDFIDDYPNLLKKEYKFMQMKYKLQAVNPQIWNFFRLRPANFPTIRIAQLSSIYSNFSNPFQQLVGCKTITELEELLSCVANKYWDTHYLFDKESSFKIKTLGSERIHLIIINVLIPMIFAFATKTSNSILLNKARKWLENLEPEKNKWLTEYGKLGFNANSSLRSQGILELYHQYCLKKKCLQCSIGNTILNAH